jgi:8-oxo-dGTP pyrophosphatase MutT (NUDIX family)
MEATRSGIRAAATVIAARPGVRGVEVLLLRRTSTSRFLPGYVVFPGGAVDPADYEHATRWFGSRDQAPRAAAVRELVEEAGLILTADGVLPAPQDEPLGLAHLRPPRIEHLPQISHWVAPEDVPVRFDARYFAVAAPPGLAPRPDGREAVEAWWADPAEIMRGWEAGDVRLYWPTMKTMEALAACTGVDELLALDIPARGPEAGDEERMPRSTFWQDDE